MPLFSFLFLILTVWLRASEQHDTTLHGTNKIKLIRERTQYPQLHNTVSLLREPTSVPNGEFSETFSVSAVDSTADGKKSLDAH